MDVKAQAKQEALKELIMAMQKMMVGSGMECEMEDEEMPEAEGDGGIKEAIAAASEGGEEKEDEEDLREYMKKDFKKSGKIPLKAEGVSIVAQMKKPSMPMPQKSKSMKRYG